MVKKVFKNVLDHMERKVPKYEKKMCYVYMFLRFGEPLTRGGFPGLNSGVILFRLDRMRKSNLYNQLLEAQNVTSLANKYSFKVNYCEIFFFKNILICNSFFLWTIRHNFFKKFVSKIHVHLILEINIKMSSV